MILCMRTETLREMGGVGCVQIILRASYRLPIAKLRGDVNGEVASSGRWARLT
jgi:hypothetical protein